MSGHQLLSSRSGVYRKYHFMVKKTNPFNLLATNIGASAPGWQQFMTWHRYIHSRRSVLCRVNKTACHGAVVNECSLSIFGGTIKSHSQMFYITLQSMDVCSYCTCLEYGLPWNLSQTLGYKLWLKSWKITLISRKLDSWHPRGIYGRIILPIL